jgi:hypothetical protein
MKLGGFIFIEWLILGVCRQSLLQNLLFLLCGKGEREFY